MTDWPKIRTDVDDDRPAREDEVEYCQHCSAAVLEGELKQHLEERRCAECRFLCADCGDAPVDERGDVCAVCFNRDND